MDNLNLFLIILFNNKDFGEKNKKPIDGKLKSLLKKHRTLKNPVAGKKRRKTRGKNKKKRKKGRRKQTKRRKRKIRSSYKKMITPKNNLFN